MSRRRRKDEEERERERDEDEGETKGRRDYEEDAADVWDGSRLVQSVYDGRHLKSRFGVI